MTTVPATPATTPRPSTFVAVGASLTYVATVEDCPTGR